MAKRQERRLKPGKDIGPLPLDEFDALHALLRAKVAELLPAVKAAMPPGQLKQPHKFDTTMARMLIETDSGAGLDAETLAHAMAWIRHYINGDARPKGQELVLPDQVARAIRDGVAGDLQRARPWLDRKRLQTRAELAGDDETCPLFVTELVLAARQVQPDPELAADHVFVQLLAILGTSTSSHVSRAQAWEAHIARPDVVPRPDGDRMLSLDTQVHLALRFRQLRGDAMRTMELNDFSDLEKLDDGIKDTILRQKGCPAAVTALSKERPSIFDLLTSVYRYQANLIEIQRKIITQVRAGKLSAREGYYECFKSTTPNSSQIIRDLQKEAMSAQSKSANSVNLQ